MAGPASNHSLDFLHHVDLAFEPQDAEVSCLHLLQALSDEWKAARLSDIECTRFTDGITNTLIKVTYRQPGKPEAEADRPAVLVRAYGAGTDGIIDREKELRAHNLLAAEGLAPALLGRFANGFVYHFVPGRPCTPQDYHDPETSRLIARKLGQWHARLPISVLCQKGGTASEQTKAGRPIPNIWTNARHWIGFLPSDTEELKARNDTFYKELDRLESLFADMPGLNGQDYVFSHTDLLCANVIITNEPADNLQNTPSVTFIDYEYATTAPAAFDISNVFAEWAGPDQVYEWVPSKSQRLAFIQQYVESFRNSSASSGAGNHSQDVEQLYQQVEAFRGVSGFYWGIWGLCQASISDIDFDYDIYAERRHSEYWGWKAEYTGERAMQGMERTVRETAWARD